jgi:hypothetical protein
MSTPNRSRRMLGDLGGVIRPVGAGDGQEAARGFID